MGSDLMADNIPPPPPGFQIVGSGATPAPQPQQRQSAPRQAYNGPTDAASLMPALIAQESGGRAGVLGPQTQWGRAIGRTQMLPDTAREMAGKLGLPYDEGLLRGTSPEAAAYQDRLGQAYLEEGLQRTGNVRDALMYYHGGPDRSLWGPKTQTYADEVLARMGNGQVVQSQAQPEAVAPPPPPGFELMAEETAPVAQTAQTGMGQSQDDPIDLTGLLYQDQVDALKKGAWVRAQNGEVYQLPGDAFTANARPSDEAQGGNIFVRRPNLEDRIGAFASAASEQIPFLDESVAATTGLLSGQGYEAMREAQAVNRDLLNQTDRGARVAGGLTGFATGFALPGGAYVGRGATGLERAGRAAQIGAGYGALYGAGAADGGIGERLQGAALGAGLGAASGGIAQAGVDRFAMQAARARANPSAARRLSREGVELTPGQMLEATPVVGPMLRGAEDAASSIPFMGSAIQGARNQTTESFNRAAINRALRPIGESLPKRTEMGYDAIRVAQDRLGQAYDDVLPRVSAQLDQPLYDEIAGVMTNAATEMPEPLVRQLGAILQNRVFRNVDQADATINGQQFKRIESELGALARDYRTASDPAARSLGTAIEDVQGAMRNLIARQNPSEAQRIRQINEGYANLTRVERAAGSSASLANEGVFTPNQLGQAVTGMGRSRSMGGRGDQLMQDLASAGKSVLPSTVGDSGTAARGAVTALIGGGAAGVLSPGLAVPVVATSLAYSRPAQAALNIIYRSTDQPGAVNKALSDLARLARDNPALVPYYEAALLRSKLDAPSQGQGRTPASRGLFGARPLQAAS